MPIDELKIHDSRFTIHEYAYTLIELMVTVTIISILSVFIFANFKDFSKDQVLSRASGQIQSILKQAQANSSSGVKCGANEASEWSVKILPSQISLICRAVSDTTDVVVKSQGFESGVSIDDITTKSDQGASICDSSSFSSQTSFTVVYQPIFQKIDFIFARGSDSQCVSTTPHGDAASPLVATKAEFVINYTKSGQTFNKNFRINTGGAIDIQ